MLLKEKSTGTHFNYVHSEIFGDSKVSLFGYTVILLFL